MVRPTAKAVAMYARAMRSFGELLDTDFAQVASLFSSRTLRRGEHFLRAGDHAEHVAFLTEGAVREYYLLSDGSERTKAFGFAGEITGSFADLISGEPSTCYVIAEEDTVLLIARFEDLRAVAANNPRWDAVFRRMLERLYLRKARREYELLALDAEARYRALKAERPDIEARAQARHIASYLGITPVHLSRLRRRLKQREGRRA